MLFYLHRVLDFALSKLLGPVKSHYGGDGWIRTTDQRLMKALH